MGYLLRQGCLPLAHCLADDQSSHGFSLPKLRSVMPCASDTTGPFAVALLLIDPVGKRFP